MTDVKIQVGTVYLSVQIIPVPAIVAEFDVDLLSNSDIGEDLIGGCNDNLSDLRTIRDALNVALGDSR